MGSIDDTPSYYPSKAEVLDFWAKERSQHVEPTADVPTGMPKRIESSLAWTADELPARRDDWTLKLSEKDVAAIESAMRDFEEAGQDHISSLSTSTFKLPQSLSARLKQTSENLYNGLGLHLIHGLDPSKHTPRQNLIIYAGVASHIFSQRGFVDQARQAVVCHIVNVQGHSNGPVSTAPAFSNTPLSFHTDNCEIMGFHYLDTAPSGGATILSSAWQTYNDLAARRPEILHTLAQPWVMDTFKSYAQFPPRHERLLQGVDSNKVLLRFSRYGMTGWQRKRNPDLPTPTTAQLEALNAVQMTAMANSFTVPAVKGDILFVNDLAIIHARQGFDEGDQYMKRHIVKMFFRDPEQEWSLPASAEAQREKMYGPNKVNGDRQELWHITHEDGLEEGTVMNG